MSVLNEIAVALTQLVNAAIGGHAGESLSARCYRAWRDGRRWGLVLRPVIDAAFFWQTEHCRNAYINALERRHLPDEYRNHAPKGPPT